MIRKGNKIVQLLTTQTPPHTVSIVQRNIQQAALDTMNDCELGVMESYLMHLQKHREYLNFFGIGVHRDQKAKIENVAKYVGLALREPPPMDLTAPEQISECKESYQNKKDMTDGPPINKDNK